MAREADVQLSHLRADRTGFMLEIDGICVDRGGEKARERGEEREGESESE